MKRVFVFFIALTLVIVCAMLSPAKVEAASASDLTFDLNSDGASYCVSSCNTKASGSLTIPSTYNGKPVTAIGDAAFYECKKLDTITIPDSIISIGDSAFDGCNLDTIYFGKNVRTVGNDAFDLLPNGQVYIADLSAWCKIEWGNSSSTPFGAKMFVNGKLLTSLDIPSDITQINDFAFRGIKGITSITIHDNVSIIGANAFNCCDSVKTVVIGNGVTEIKRWAFGQCDDLKNLTIGPNVVKLGDGVFTYCHSLEEVTLPDSITKIPDYLFDGCENLKKVTLGNKVTHIGGHAFGNCENLTSIVIPRTVKEIEAWAFYNCESLTDVYYNGSQAECNSIDFNYANDELLNAAWHSTNPCANGHSYGNWKHIDNASHERVCSRCGEKETSSHAWNSGNTTKHPTCKEEGVKAYTCTGCNATKTEAIAKLSTHSYDNGKVTKEATCKEEGIKTYTCTVCKETKTEAIAKLTTHTPGAEATATTPQICTVCGKELKPATGATEPPATVPPATEPTVTPTQPEGNKNPDDGEFPIIVVIAIVVLGGGGATAGVILWKKKH